jgi:Uma2 family endonuclease
MIETPPNLLYRNVHLQLPAGDVVALNVSEDDYMQHYAGDFHEWVQGVVIKMSPASLSHDAITQYIRQLLAAYFSLRPIGRVVGAPYVMRLPYSRREPDLMVVLDARQDQLRPTHLNGPADIAIEVVSPSNEEVDYGAKLREYEAGGVSEYWIIDPIRRVCHFHRLTDERYLPQATDEQGAYRTALLPDFHLPTRVLWRLNLPNVVEVVQFVQAMLSAT